jgi:hypothetical protein
LYVPPANTLLTFLFFLLPLPSTPNPQNQANITPQSHLHSQLAQLSANLADLENLLRMTSVQAESIKGLGAFHGGLFMAASKVLGEETVAGGAGKGGEGKREGE